MAAKNMNSDFVDAYLNDGGKLRQQNFRGQLMHTSVHTHDLNATGSDWPKAEINSILAVTLIPFRASIKEIKLQFDTATNELKFKVGIAGIMGDHSLEVIKDDIGAGEIGATKFVKDKVVSIWNYTLNYKTLFQMLHDDSKKPIDNFKPYVNDKYGVLIFKVTTAENTNTPRNTYIDIDWTEQSPSDTSAFSAVIPNTFPHGN